MKLWDAPLAKTVESRKTLILDRSVEKYDLNRIKPYLKEGASGKSSLKEMLRFNISGHKEGGRTERSAGFRRWNSSEATNRVHISRCPPRSHVFK
jgi:hypothetical protein